MPPTTPPAPLPTLRARHKRALPRACPVFSPNELIRAVWARPPQPWPDRRATGGVGYIVIELLREGGLLNFRDSPASWRWSALLLTLLYQLVWCVLLIWLMYVRFWIIPWAAPGDGPSGEGAIEVTFIEAPAPVQTTTLLEELPRPLSESLPPPLPVQLPERTPLPSTDAIAEPAPRHEPPPAVVVTNVEDPDSAFTLYVPELRSTQAPALPETAPAVIATREIVLNDIPLLQRPAELRPSAPELTVQTPAAPVPELALPQRDIPSPLPEIELPPLRLAQLQEIVLPASARAIHEREIVLSAPTMPPAASASTFEAHEINLTPSTSSTQAESFDTWERQEEQPAARTGSALVDAYGRPRLAGDSARNGGGLPPGTIVEDYANIDRMGAWLKRSPSGYQPSQLEQLWVPHENILEEWVRRSIKNIWIPIPGTNKVIRCTVVLLMLGGGCGISDPNMLDIEATSRPPPDVPFKPELHEDQQSLARPATDSDQQK